MQRWIDGRGRHCQWEQIFINNGYGVEYRPLRKITIGAVWNRRREKDKK